MERTLTEPQERALINKHLRGDFGEHRWSTIKALLDSGMIEDDGKYLCVSRLGVEYCNEFHALMPLSTPRKNT
jgi:hypothetical protein